MRFQFIFLVVLFFLHPLNMLGAEENPPTIIYAIGPNGSPYYEKDPGSKYGWKGLFIEILDKVVVKELGMKLVVQQSPWKRAQENVRDGTADIIVSVPTQDRLAYAFSSKEPIFNMWLNVYTYTGHPKIDKIRKIQTPNDIIALNLVPASNQGNGWHKENIDAFGVKTFYVPTDENLVQFLAMRRADIMIDAPISINRIIRQYDLTAKIVQTDARFGPVNFHLLISKKSKHAYLMPKINETINKLVREGVVEKILLKYSGPD